MGLLQGLILRRADNRSFVICISAIHGGRRSAIAHAGPDSPHGPVTHRDGRRTCAGMGPASASFAVGGKCVAPATKGVHLAENSSPMHRQDPTTVAKPRAWRSITRAIGPPASGGTLYAQLALVCPLFHCCLAHFFQPPLFPPQGVIAQTRPCAQYATANLQSPATTKRFTYRYALPYSCIYN